MKNQYMFFNEQAFENFDLAEYIRNDILIPKTNIHIYEFECVETDVCSDDAAALLFALKDPENILRVVMGEKIGTVVKEEN